MNADVEQNAKEAPAFVVFDGPRDLRIEVPSKMRLGLLFMNCLGVLMTLSSISMSISRPDNIDEPFLGYPALLFGALALAGTVWGTLYMLGGKAVVTIDGMAIRIARGILGIGWTRSYPLAEVANLRYTENIAEELKKAGKHRWWKPEPAGPSKTKDSKEAKPTEGVVFDHEGHPRWLVHGVKEGEAHALIVEIVHRYPELGRRDEENAQKAMG